MTSTLAAVTSPPLILESKVYILVRRDLPWSVRIVQATHAAMQLAATQTIEGWEQYGPAVVLLAVADERELTDWLARLGSGAVGFREPDMHDSLTAVAYYGEASTLFSGLRLM